MFRKSCTVISWLILLLSAPDHIRAAELNATTLYKEYKCVTNGTSAPPQKTLSNVLTANLSLPGNPYEIIYATAHKNIAFISLTHTYGNSSLGVLNTTDFQPKLLHEIGLQKAQSLIARAGVFGFAQTHDGRHLFLAAGSGAIVIDTALAVAGSDDAVVGILNGNTTTQAPGNGAIEVSISKDDDYVFISQESGPNPTLPNLPFGNIDVFRLNKTGTSVTGVPTGFLDLGIDVVSTTLSADGRMMFPTSEQVFANDFHGLLNVVNVTTLESNPAKALLANVTTGCGAARSVLSPDGKTIWVAARYDNTLLAYDVDKVVSDPSDALVANVTVGTSPIGFAFVRNGSRIITADSNRFNISGPAGLQYGLSVVDVDVALSGNDGQKAVLGRIPTGYFARNVAVSPDGRTALVTVYGSSNATSGEVVAVGAKVQAIDIASLP